MVIVFHPAASDELDAAHDWYAGRSPVASERFLEELDLAMSAIENHPDCGAMYLHETRCYLMRRFPYLVVYHRPNAETIEIVAVAHGRRRPGYWAGRKK